MFAAPFFYTGNFAQKIKNPLAGFGASERGVSSIATT
jgi:hypothetical protein